MTLKPVFLALAAALAVSPAHAQTRTVHATVVGIDPVYAPGQVRQVCQPYQQVHYPTTTAATVVAPAPTSFGLYYDTPVVVQPHVAIQPEMAAPLAYGSGQYCHVQYENPLSLMGYDVTYFFAGRHYVSRLNYSPAVGSTMAISIPAW